MDPSMDSAPEPESFAHKERPEDQLEDATKWRWFHIKAIIISGVGFFTDAYDLQVISGAIPMIAFARWPGETKATHVGDLNKHGPGSMPTVLSLIISVIALIGTLTGQLIFGFLGDKLGRKGAYGVTLTIMIVMTVLQSGASWGNHATFLGLFLTWRMLLGIGIGGDYPLSAVISSEYASTNLRGPMIAAVFTMQGLGALTAALVGLVVTACYKNAIINNCNIHDPCKPMDSAWRVIMGLGAVPAVATFYLRLKLPESPRFVAQVDHDTTLAMQKANIAINNETVGEEKLANNGDDRITFKTFWNYISRRKNALILAGTAGSWFFVDVAFYSGSLFTPTVLTNIGFNPSVTMKSTSTDMYRKVFKTWEGNAIILFCGTLPGYFFTVVFINRLGRMFIQKMGFIIMTIMMVIMAAAYPQLLPSAHNGASIHGTPWAYIVLFCLMFFFTNFGPNTTTFIVPGELNPAKFRSFCHGISAATGKLGAIVGAYGFGWVVIGAQNKISTKYPMDTTNHAMQFAVGLMSIMSVLGLCTTFLIPETTGLSLEEIVRKYHDWDENEDEAKELEDGPIPSDEAMPEYPEYPVVNFLETTPTPVDSDGRAVQYF